MRSRRAFSATLSDSLSLFATRYSVADYTPADFTADGFPAAACSHHGFAAKVCTAWSKPAPALAYVCGAAPAGAAPPSQIASLLADPLQPWIDEQAETQHGVKLNAAPKKKYRRAL